MLKENKSSKDVLIAGGGFAGLVTAIMLKKHNIPCKVFEANSKIIDSGDRLTMFTNAMKILRLIGVSDDVILNGFTLELIKFQDQGGNHMAYRSMGRKENYGEPTMTIRRNMLHSILRQKAEAVGVEILYEKKVIDISQTDSEVRMIFEDESYETGSLIIGCDGINSIVRRTVLGKTILPNYSGLTYYGGFVDQKELIKKVNLKPKTVYVSVGQTHFFTYCYLCNPNRPDVELIHWNCFLHQPKRLQKKDLDKLSNHEIIKRVLPVYAGWNDPIEEIVSNSSELWKNSISDIVEIERWSKKRVIVIGDAAHAMSPLLGQGAGTSIEDGYALAELLAKFNGDYTKAFLALEKLRKPRTTYIAKKARKNSIRTTIQFNKLTTKLRNVAFSLITYLVPEKIQNNIQLYDLQKELEKVHKMQDS